ncbi:phosphoenolpyruvate--protein phosphotransferase [Shewanella corallii]|uniref:phosphoenolpyruvate--protein phosphotransferase n=1 Tax=Shewanella corallii TaxID=560080 RepID=A0ABT0N5N0_9GAMM|nr:phosphoenolpyruvate--protein phosphotransferase [Shewanella corallii]
MLTTLRDITQSVAMSSSLEEALTSLVQRTKQAMMTQCCSVYLLEEQQLILSATDGLAVEAIGKVIMPLSEGLVGLVAQREELVNLAKAHLHPRFKIFPEAAEEHFQAFLAAPIIYQKQVLGVIVVQQNQARQFSEGEEAFLMTLAAQLAMAIHSLKQKVSHQSLGSQPVIYQGTGASRGIAIAHALVLGADLPLEQAELKAKDIDAELERLNNALGRSRDSLNALLQRFEREDDEVSHIMEALLLLLDEQSLGGEYLAEVRAGWMAESAVSRVSLKYIAQFSAMDDNYLKERSRDIKELGQRVLRQLIEPGKVTLHPGEPVILVAREADTGLLAEFPRQKLAGVVTELGGVNSHAAIVARALGVPALTGVEQLLNRQLDGRLMVINANRGQLLVEPGPSVIEEYRSLIASEKAQQREYASELHLPAVTQDEKRIHLYINAGLLSGVENQLAEAADGIGLYRSEIPFMLEQRFPSESAQVKVYRQVLKAASGRPVVMRTLDVGGDKPLPYFPIKEENPSLGWRGVRFSLDHPELFLIQLRAMMTASVVEHAQLSILLPMVSSIDEIDMALAYFEQAFEELQQEYGSQALRPKIGIMLEVPVLLFQLEEVAQRVDFVSVGSNDLTQYLLAVDRNNPRVSGLFDAYHPGILRALRRARIDCDKYGLDVSVCGELAGEPMGALLLVAMGYDRLSMNQGNLAMINYLLRRVSCAELQNLLLQSLSQSEGQDVREVVREFLMSLGLGNTVSH